MERYIRGSINDEDSSVVNAALLSSYEFYKLNEEVVRKWSLEVL